MSVELSSRTSDYRMLLLLSSFIPKVHVIGSLERNLTRTFDASHANRKRLRDDFLNRYRSLLYSMTEKAPPTPQPNPPTIPTPSQTLHQRLTNTAFFGINRITTTIPQVGLQNVRPPTGGTLLTT
jgi:hypothetical protein